MRLAALFLAAMILPVSPMLLLACGPRTPPHATLHAPGVALPRVVCLSGDGRCNGDRPEVCRGDGADAAWFPVRLYPSDHGDAVGQSGRPLACREFGALCSVEPDGMAVCVDMGGASPP